MSGIENENEKEPKPQDNSPVVNLDEDPIPPFSILYQGTIHYFDPLAFSVKLKPLQDLQDPETVCKLLQEVTQLDLSPSAAIRIARAFDAFMTELEPLLKKVFGDSLVSGTSTDSPNPNTPA